MPSTGIQAACPSRQRVVASCPFWCLQPENECRADRMGSHHDGDCLCGQRGGQHPAAPEGGEGPGAAGGARGLGAPGAAGLPSRRRPVARLLRRRAACAAAPGWRCEPPPPSHTCACPCVPCISDTRDTELQSDHDAMRPAPPPGGSGLSRLWVEQHCIGSRAKHCR